jgi:hypothetical protein
MMFEDLPGFFLPDFEGVTGVLKENNDYFVQRGPFPSPWYPSSLAIPGSSNPTELSKFWNLDVYFAYTAEDRYATRVPMLRLGIPTLERPALISSNLCVDRGLIECKTNEEVVDRILSKSVTKGGSHAVFESQRDHPLIGKNDDDDLTIIRGNIKSPYGKTIRGCCLVPLFECQYEYRQFYATAKYPQNNTLLTRNIAWTQDVAYGFLCGIAGSKIYSYFHPIVHKDASNNNVIYYYTVPICLPMADQGTPVAQQETEEMESNYKMSDNSGFHWLAWCMGSAMTKAVR